MSARMVETDQKGVWTWPCEKCGAIPEFVGIETGDFTGYAEHWVCSDCGEGWIVQVPC